MTKRILVWGLALAALFGGAERVSAQSYTVITHPSASFDAIAKDDLSKIFQKKSRELPDGTTARPVDLDKSSPVREAFSEAVHGRGVNAIESFWQQQIFSGKDVPPDALGSDAEVVAFVSANPGAIGYVSSGASLSGVKQVTVN